MAGVTELCTDLMGSPGDEPAFQKGETVLRGQRCILSDSRLGANGAFIRDEYLVFGGVLENKASSRPLFGLISPCTTAR
jgi:hypothetical protein